ncbi:MAG: M20 family peptidase [Gemmatimonadales bacterium]|nr:MAG: M20 family peptidase [Gemmatimonadales bacterium]
MSRRSGRATSRRTAPTSSESASAVDLARALVAVPSVNPELEAGGDGEDHISTLVAGWLEDWGFRVRRTEVAPGRFNVVARVGGGGPTLVLNGHLDTVGVEGMTLDPFDPHVTEDGLLQGRGSADMKGGLAALLVAARARARQLAAAPASSPPGTLIVLLTADEEHASVGLEAEIAGGFEAPEPALAVVCEPTSLAVATANKGFVWTTLRVHGRAAHGSRPEEGRDAVVHAGRILAALDRWPELEGSPPPHPLLGRGTIHAGPIRGGTSPSVIPAHCQVVLEARTLPGETPESVRDRIQSLADSVARDGLRVELEPGMERPPAELSPDHAGVTALAAAMEAEGASFQLRGMTAWVEASWLLEAGIPALCFGPGSIGRAHTADEACPVEEIETAARVLTRLATDPLPL